MMRAIGAAAVIITTFGTPSAVNASEPAQDDMWNTSAVVADVAPDAPWEYSVTDRFHAFYAMPNNITPDFFNGAMDINPDVLVPKIRHELKQARDWFATQTGDRRPRFVSGANGIEVTVTTLPVSIGEIYQGGWQGHERLRGMLVSQGLLRPNEIAIMYLPALGNACGSTRPETPGHPAFAIIFLANCGIYPAIDSKFPFGGTYLVAHEMTHALGAARNCATHSDGTGHVTDDSRDIISSIGRDWNNLMLDPGHDDYYGHGRTDCEDMKNHPVWLEPGTGGCDGTPAGPTPVPTSGTGPPTGAAAGFVGTGPTRLFDTRQTPLTSLCPGQIITAQVAGRAGVPQTGVSAAVLNVTVTGAAADGYISIWPADQARPNASAVNFAAGESTANLVVASLSPDGRIAIWNSNDSFNMDATHVIVDVVGYLQPQAGFAGLTPTRLLDTRSGNGAPAEPVAPGAEVTLQVTGRPSIPVAGVSAIALNVTVTQTEADGYVSVWPDGQTRPNVSSLNFAAGDSRANLVIVPVGPTGAVKLWNANDSAQMRSVALIADAVGYFTSGGAYHAVAPARIADTRTGLGATGPIAAGDQRNVTATGTADVPANAVAVTVNMTATRTAGGGYLTTWPAGTARPGTSSLNWAAGQTIANAAIATLGTGGRLTVWNANDSPANGNTDVIIDISGYFTP